MLRSLVIASVLLAGCYPSRGAPPIAMTTPIAITGINTPFDEVNASDPSLPYRKHLTFSSNRGSQGGHYDLWVTELEWSRPGDDDARASTVSSRWPPRPFDETLMTSANERSPIELGGDDWFGYGGVLAFSSDRASGNGGYDLYATSCISSFPSCSPTTRLVPLAFNTPADEMYLTRPFAPRTLLFASNRDSVVGAGPTKAPNDIYLVRWALPAPGTKTIPVAQRDADSAVKDPDSIASVPAAIERVAALSTDADDTAPFVYKAGDSTEVVFVSDRAGGLGQHDLYCARYSDNAWQKPKHLASASSAADELRPIVLEINRTRFLLFSSTRPGGQGGYDLYVVGYSGCR